MNRQSRTAQRAADRREARQVASASTRAAVTATAALLPLLAALAACESTNTDPRQGPVQLDDGTEKWCEATTLRLSTGEGTTDSPECQ